MSELVVSHERNVLNPNSRTFEEREAELLAIEESEQAARERAKKSTYSDFAQLNRKNIAHLIAACNADKQAVRVLLFIMEHMDKYNALVCSYAVFQEQLDISRATVTRAIKYLKDHGFIAIYRSGTSNVYVMNDDLVWTNYGDRHKYCKFPANVILSASEQTKQATYTSTKIMEHKDDK